MWWFRRGIQKSIGFALRRTTRRFALERFVPEIERKIAAASYMVKLRRANVVVHVNTPALGQTDTGVFTWTATFARRTLTI